MLKTLIQWTRIQESLNESFSIGKREDAIIDYIKKQFPEVDEINPQVSDELLIINIQDKDFNVVDLQIVIKKLKTKLGDIFNHEAGVNHHTKTSYFSIEVNLNKLYAVPSYKIDQIITYNKLNENSSFNKILTAVKDIDDDSWDKYSDDSYKQEKNYVQIYSLNGLKNFLNKHDIDVSDTDIVEFMKKVKSKDIFSDDASSFKFDNNKKVLKIITYNNKLRVND